MGYRSEVLLYVGPEVMSQFLVTMAKCQEARALCFAEHSQMVKDYCDIKGSFLFKWDWLKWYDSYPCVAALEDFMDWCDGEEIPTGEKDSDGNDKKTCATEFFRFVRMGEEIEDTEQRGDAFWGDVGIERTIMY